MSSTTDLASGIIILLVVSGVLMFANLQINEYSPGKNFYSGGEAVLGVNLTTGTHPQFNTSDLPEAEESVSTSDGNIFTDTFRTIKNWLLNEVGGSIIINVLGAPFMLLNAMGLNPVVTAIITAVWYGTFFFLIVAWLRGL